MAQGILVWADRHATSAKEENVYHPVPCGSAVVRTALDAAWDSKWATVYYKRAVIKFCHLKPRDEKMPIAVNSSAALALSPSPGTLCHHPMSGGPRRLFTIQGVDQPSRCTSGGGGGVNASVAVYMSRTECATNFNVCARLSF